MKWKRLYKLYLVTVLYVSLLICPVVNFFGQDCISDLGLGLRITSQASYISLPSHDEIELEVLASVDTFDWHQVRTTGFASPATNQFHILKLDFCNMPSSKNVLSLGTIPSYISVYQKFNGDVEDSKSKYLTGDHYGDHRFPVRIFEAESDIDFSIYILIHNAGGTVRLPIFLYPDKLFHRHIVREELQLGLSMGMLTLLLIASLLVGWATRHISFFFYGLMVFGYLLMLGSVFGHYYIYFLDRNMLVNSTISYLGVLMHILGLCGISVVVLKLPDRSIYFYRFMKWLAIFSIGMYLVFAVFYNLLPEVNISPTLRWAQLSVLSIPIIMASMSAYISLKYQDKSGPIIILSFTLSLAIILFYALAPYGYFSVYGWYNMRWLPVLEAGILMYILSIAYIKRQKQYAILLKEKVERQNEEVKIIQQVRRDERVKISDFLHNRLGLKLSVIKMRLSNADSQAIASIDDVAKDIRNMSHTLNPIILKERGLIECIEDEVYRIEDSNPNLIISFQHSPYINQLHIEMIEVLYHVFLELMQNIIHHGNASKIDIALNSNINVTTLMIEDDSDILYDPHGLHSGTGIRRILSDIQPFDGKLEVKKTETASILHMLTLRSEHHLTRDIPPTV